MIDPVDEMTEAMAAMDGGRPVRAWPTTAAAMNAATGGYGTWASIWLCDEASGSLADSVGAVTMAAESSPTYRNAGAITRGTDFAVGFDSGLVDNFKAGAAATYNLDDVTSIAVYYCFKAPAAGAAQGIGGKLAAAQPYWYWLCANASGHLRLALSDGTDTAAATLAQNHCDGLWHDALFFIDRTANVAQVVSDLGSSATASLAAVGTLSNTDLFRLGGHPLDASLGHTLAFAAVATGDIVNLRANATAAIASVRALTGRT